jgi:hypothetical protein
MGYPEKTLVSGALTIHAIAFSSLLDWSVGANTYWTLARRWLSQGQGFDLSMCGLVWLVIWKEVKIPFPS